MGLCQAAVAEAVEAFGKLDVLLCCSSEALVGTVEELAASPRTQSLVREQFETNFFGPVNCIKAALPTMRKQNSGHIMVLTGISGSENPSQRVRTNIVSSWASRDSGSRHVLRCRLGT